MVSPWGLLAFIALLAIGLYWPTLNNFYVSDDFVLLYYGMRATTQEVWQTFVPEFAGAPRGGFYRPLGLLLWKWGYLIGGGDPFVQHVFNIGLHAINSVLVFVVARRLGLTSLPAFCAAITFVLFPTHAEAVSWLSGRFDLLATLFALLALILWLRESIRSRCLAGMCLILSLTSKETALIFPGLLVLIIGLQFIAARQMSWAPARRIVYIVAPAVLIVGGYLALRFLVFGGLGGYVNQAGTSLVFTATSADLWQMLHAARIYLTLPLNWSRASAYAASFSWWLWIGAMAVAGLACVMFVAQCRQIHSLRTIISTQSIWALSGISLGWIALSLIPLLGPGDWATELLMGGRLMYLPSIGVCFLLAAWLFHIEIFVRRGVRFRRITVWRTLLLFCIWTISAGIVLAANQRWHEAGQQARGLLEQIKQQYPNVQPQTTFLLPPLPDNHEGAYVFRNGIEEAIRVTYDDDQLYAAPISAPPIILVRPDRVVPLQFEADKLRPAQNATAFEEVLRLRTQVPALRAVDFGSGFHAREQAGVRSWRWLGRQACLTLEFDHSETVDMHIRVWSAGPKRQLQIDYGEQRLKTLTVTAEEQEVTLPNISFGAGSHCLQFIADGAASPSNGAQSVDPREISVAVGDVRLSPAPRLAVAPTPQQPAASVFVNGVHLLGYDVLRAPGPLRSDQQIRVILYWYNTRVMSENLFAFVHLYATDGSLVAQADDPPSGSMTSTAEWQASTFYRGQFTITLPADLVPGMYELRVGLYDLVSQNRVAVTSGKESDQSVLLTKLPVRSRPDVQPWH
ncbi:MAG: hypothetical protein MI924_06720 [Chloroflexales bacterium]|nr:hypothetical protein [Chloroflexales bacterium]